MQSRPYAERRALGIEGARRAASYLADRGYRIVDRNVRAGGVEIYLVVACGSTLVFVEVKTRRATRFGGLVGVEGEFRAPLAQAVVGVMRAAYPQRAAKADWISPVGTGGEERFQRNIAAGMARLDSVIDGLAAEGATTIPGAEVFRLYDTYGFPVDLTRIVAEGGLAVTRPSMMRTWLTPPARASSPHSTLGIMPPFIVPPSIQARACGVETLGDSSLSLPRMPSTSVSSMSLAAPSARAMCEAARSALML